MTDDKIKELSKDYMEGSTYKELQEKYSITPNELKWIIQKNNWKRKSNRRKAQKGNKNAKGNKGGTGAKKGNKNAVTTGEYETLYYDLLSEEEKAIFNNYEVADKKQELLKELKWLEVRKFKMMKKIQEIEDKEKEMIVEDINKRQYNSINADETEITTHATHNVNLLQKLYDSLTRIQEEKKKYIDSLHKIENDDRKLELEIIRLEREAAKDGASEDDNVKDDSFIKALEDSAESTWDDYEQETESDPGTKTEEN